MRYHLYMNVEQVQKYWLKQSDGDWKVSQGLFSLGHYAYALFFCHLCLEKLFKAIIVQKTGKQSPYSHDLLYLVEKSKIKITSAQKEQLNDITQFNVRARYDDIKNQFYKKATRGYSEKYIEITKKIRIWLKKNYL